MRSHCWDPASPQPCRDWAGDQQLSLLCLPEHVNHFSSLSCSPLRNGNKAVVSEKGETQAWDLREEGYGKQVGGTYLAPKGALDASSQAGHRQDQEAGKVDSNCHDAADKSTGSRKLCKPGWRGRGGGAGETTKGKPGWEGWTPPHRSYLRPSGFCPIQPSACLFPTPPFFFIQQRPSVHPVLGNSRDTEVDLSLRKQE